MKKLIALMLLLATLAVLVACGNDNNNDNNDDGNGDTPGLETPMIPLDPDIFG